MKPLLFKNEHELISFLESVPRPEGEVKLGKDIVGANEVIARTIAIVPRIFELRDVLVKGQGGLGSKKALYRFAEAAGDNIATEVIKDYNEACEKIILECEELFEGGMSDDLVDRVHSVKTALAQFKAMKSSIEGFKEKLDRQVVRVEKKYEESLEELKKIRTTGATKDALATVLSELEENHKNVQDLAKKLNEYCNLQIAYNSIFIGNFSR